MRVAIVAGTRTAFVKAGGDLSRYSQIQLARDVVIGCVERYKLDASLIDELYFGSVLLDPRIPNLAREIVLTSGLPKSISGHFVSNNCITGLLAALGAFEGIQSGRIRCALAGGVESMSQPTLTLSRAAEGFFIRLAKSRSLRDKILSLRSFKPAFLLPNAPSPKEPSTGLTMGQHCELMAQEYGISRRDQDEYALRSHRNAVTGLQTGVLSAQIIPIGEVSRDNLIREKTSLEQLASLPNVFDKGPKGTISAGNASALTDGASVVCLMAESLAQSQGVEILGYLDALEFASVPTGDGLLMAPAITLPRVLQRTGLSVDDIDLFEIHEAFAAQVLCNLHAWEHGWPYAPTLSPIGAIPREKINIFGGSLALGHPFAATGARLLLHACLALREKNLRRAAISICAAGAGAGAAIVSR
jgi:acetyl-CoA acetyltransferase family protein